MVVITEKQIGEWKQAHGAVYEMCVENRRAYFRSPDRQTLSYALCRGQQDPAAATEVVARNCFLGGDIGLLEEDAFFLTLVDTMGKLLAIKEASLKKL